MGYYYFIEAVVGVVAGLLLAIRSKKAEGVTYGKLDQTGRTVNIVLLVVYALLSPLYLILGALCEPAHDGVLGVVGGIVSVIAASAALFCAIGLGASVALRKKGRSKLSFAVQFAGLIGIGLTLALFFIFYGNLLAPIN